ncbi:tetratricopeptide repeat protein [Flavobacterium cerinum]|uniref:Tetratricopeptide repeat protein n=1 Tax=Flavobacterium cerinum TaxID=2502784 RepID=A0A3S3QLM2_9FLAO|nr:tetratricopeptide repeat protein [Flavobacterium cerinum]RWW92010.1 tetratricopeptide repeat protein [Flavobacterium cerinum]
MSHMFIYRRNYLIVALIFFSAVNSNAQSKRKIDSIIATAKLDVYENPDRVIKIGDSIYTDPESTIEDKVMGLMLISDAYSSKRDYQKSLKYFQTANTLSKKVNNIDLQIKVLSKMAVKYQQLKVYDKAIQYLDECDKLIASDPINESTLGKQATNDIIRGVIYKEQLNCNIAIDYFNKGIAKYEKNNAQAVQPNLSIANYNKGNCYILISDYESAKKSFLQSIKNADNINANSLKAFAQKGLAEVYALEGNHHQAIKVLQEALKISKNVGDLILNRGIYNGLANNYLAVNDWQQYQKYNKLFLQNQLIIKESERRSINDSIDELTEVHNQKLTQVKTRYSYIISIVVFLILIMIYLLYKYQMRSVKSIEMLNLEIKRIKSTLKKE